MTDEELQECREQGPSIANHRAHPSHLRNLLITFLFECTLQHVFEFSMKCILGSSPSGITVFEAGQCLTVKGPFITSRGTGLGK